MSAYRMIRGLQLSLLLLAAASSVAIGADTRVLVGAPLPVARVAPNFVGLSIEVNFSRSCHCASAA